MCKRNVQTGCTGYVHIAAMRMMENNGCFLQFIKLSPVDVMRLSLGAWWPEGRSSSSVSQFLPSCSWSACQMAAEWKDGYRGDLSPWLFLQLCFCSVWGRCPAERGGQTQRCAQLSARLSAELCSPDLWRYCTTLRCTESIHFLWPLNRKFSELLVRPWISSAVADGRGVATGGDGGDTSPTLLETGDSVPRIFLTQRQYFRPCSLICYLDLSELTFSQSQRESSLGRVCHELQISSCSCEFSFVHSLCCLAVWGKMHPRKKQRTITSFFQTHTVSMCYSMSRWHESRDKVSLLWFNLL